ncbi:MAG: aminotransferase class IV [Gammaproteobacteria bacterium]|jgi:D-alanine transaminase|tara:strand:+ start:126 stop:962 length:837 start_codon:yes stop_codon:yes gene_type:complete
MWVFLNGRILREDKARISPLDRGFTFADGVYEVIPSYNNKRFLFEEHLTRLKKSLNKLFIPCPQVLDELNSILSELHKKNGFKNQFFYIQITRGVQDIRSHEAESEILPTVFITSQNLDLNPYRNNPDKKGLSVRLEEDIRWARCDIKTTGLTGNILSSHDPSKSKVDEIIFHKNGIINEGSKSNVFILIENSILTPSLDQNILPGITRDFIIEKLRGTDLEVLETEVSLDQFRSAEEIWLTSSTKEIQPVQYLDDFELPRKNSQDYLWLEVLNYFNH